MARRKAITLARAKQIAELLQTHSYAQAAMRLGLTKNAAIGVVDRARRHYGFSVP